MDKWLENDLTVRLVSLFLALILWLQVAREIPQTQKAILGVPVQVRDLPADVEPVGIEPAAITVVVRGRGKRFESLGKEDFVALVSLADARPGRVVYTIDRVTVPKGVTLVGYTPEQVMVSLETVGEKQLTVRVRVLGRPAQGFSAGNPTASQAEVVARGRESLLKGATAAEVAVNISGVNEPWRGDSPVVVLDAQGTRLRDVKVAPEAIEVTVPISPSSGTRTGPTP